MTLTGKSLEVKMLVKLDGVENSELGSREKLLKFLNLTLLNMVFGFLVFLF